MKTPSITALASCLCVLGSGFTSHVFASSGRAHFGFEVITSGDIGLEMNEGQVLLRDLVSGSTSTYSASTTLSLSEGRYLIAANTIDASFALSWTTQSVGEGVPRFVARTLRTGVIVAAPQLTHGPPLVDAPRVAAVRGEWYPKARNLPGCALHQAPLQDVRRDGEV